MQRGEGCPEREPDAGRGDPPLQGTCDVLAAGKAQRCVAVGACRLPCLIMGQLNYEQRL